MRAFWFWTLAYIALLLAAVGIAAREPIAFQKANVITPAAPSVPDLAPTQTSLDIGKIVGAIPYRGGEVWSVEPTAKYDATILGGSGNCATKTMGLAYHLGETAVDYQIIDLASPDNFLIGDGHTLLRVAYEHEGDERVGLVDLLEGGLPTDGDRYFDVTDLVDGAIPNAHVDPLNERKDDHARYFGEFLDGVIVAYRPAAEVNRYHNFIASVYLPLGHDKLEKYVYDGVALMFGFLPSVHVTEYDRLVENVGTKIALHRAALWTLRSSLIILPLLLVIGWRMRRPSLRRAAWPRAFNRRLDADAN